MELLAFAILTSWPWLQQVLSLDPVALALSVVEVAEDGNAPDRDARTEKKWPDVALQGLLGQTLPWLKTFVILSLNLKFDL